MVDPNIHRGKPSSSTESEPPTPLGDVLMSSGALAAVGAFLLWAAYKLFTVSSAVVQDDALHGRTPRHHDDTDFMHVVLPSLGGLALFAGAVLLLVACRTIYRQIRDRPLLDDHDFDEVPFDRSLDSQSDEG